LVLAIVHSTPLDVQACQVLAAAGAGAFEVDLRLINGEVVVTHFLDVIPGWKGLQRYNWRFRITTGSTVYVTLTEALAVIPSSCRISLDLKDESAQKSKDLLEAIASKVVDDGSRFIACSKNWSTLEAVTTPGFGTWASVSTRSAMLRALASPPKTTGITIRHTLLNRENIEALRDAGLQVIAWTVNDVERAEELIDYGIHAVTTDQIAVVKMIATRT
jgi:glycerophosphoryl diester phosphodiesterase